MIPASPGARRVLRRPAGVWTLILPFNAPDLTAANKPNVTVSAAPTTATHAGRSGALFPHGTVINWSACPGFDPAATIWTLDFWGAAPPDGDTYCVYFGGFNVNTMLSADWRNYRFVADGAAANGYVDGLLTWSSISAPLPAEIILNHFGAPDNFIIDDLTLTVGRALFPA